jgi:hypothetical protein
VGEALACTLAATAAQRQEGPGHAPPADAADAGRGLQKPRVHGRIALHGRGLRTMGARRRAPWCAPLGARARCDAAPPCRARPPEAFKQAERRAHTPTSTKMLRSTGPTRTVQRGVTCDLLIRIELYPSLLAPLEPISSDDLARRTARARRAGSSGGATRRASIVRRWASVRSFRSWQVATALEPVRQGIAPPTAPFCGPKAEPKANPAPLNGASGRSTLAGLPAVPVSQLSAQSRRQHVWGPGAKRAGAGVYQKKRSAGAAAQQRFCSSCPTCWQP